jgi:hypothetical protein
MRVLRSLAVPRAGITIVCTFSGDLRHSDQVRLLVLFLLAVCVRAAVVEGVVLDEETGNPLARTLVTLTALPGTNADDTHVRTGARGSFVILSVRPGWYVLRTTRRGYVPAEAGESRPGRPGHAFLVADDRTSGFIQIHMTHLAAIAGAVLDENNLGIPHWTVHIYTAGKPMRHVAQIDTDDRGDYRIGELDAGNYLLRAGPGHFEDDTEILATYTRQAVELKDAYSVSVRAGETQKKVLIYPVKGKLLTLSGMFSAPAWPGGAIFTFVADTGRRQIAAGSGDIPFRIPAVQPGPVELIVKGQDATGAPCGSYQQLPIDRDLTALRVACNPIFPGSIPVNGATLKSPLIVRRVDLDGAQEAHALNRDELLEPGHWELAVPRGDYYVVAVRNNGRPVPPSGDWYPFEASNRLSVSVTLSPRAAKITGVVLSQGQPVGGAPIFLTLSATGQIWNARSDPQGNYSIGGLAPGMYNIISGFDLDNIFDPQKSDSVTTIEGGDTAHPLELVLQ